MKYVYTAANLPDAQLVLDLLERSGVPAHIFNANAMSAFGGLPMSAAYPQVWIAQPQQEPQARLLIADYQQQKPEPAVRVCSTCNESSPGEFELCWNCGATLPTASA